MAGKLAVLACSGVLALMVWAPAGATETLLDMPTAEPALVKAARLQDMPAVASLISGQPLNQTDVDGQSALLWAVQNLNLPIAEALLKAGADANLSNTYGWTPLHVAAQAGDASLVKALLGAKANANATNWADETPLMLATKSGSLETVNLLLAGGADPNAHENRHGQTALMWAAAAGSSDIAAALLAHKAQVDLASPSIDIEIPIFLTSTVLTNGVKPGKAGGQTPLMFAATTGNRATVEVLVNAGANINARSADGSTPLLLSTYRHVPLMEAWPFDFAIDADLDIARLLLAKGADPNTPDANGMSPLMAAVFIAYGSEKRGQSANEPVTFYPKDAKGEAVAGLLLANGADPNQLLADYVVPAPAGQDPRTESHFQNISPFLMAGALNKPRLIDLMLKSGKVKIDARRQNGNTPLIDAADLNSLPAVKALVDAGADVNAVNKAGQTALHKVANPSAGGGAIATLLISQGARPGRADKAGATPISLAKIVPPPAARGGGRNPSSPDQTFVTIRGLSNAEGPSGQTVITQLANGGLKTKPIAVAVSSETETAKTN